MKSIFDNADKTRVNRSVAGSVQPALTVSEPGDPLEEEAGRVADEVMRQSEEEEEPIQAQRQEPSPWLQRQADGSDDSTESRVQSRTLAGPWIQRENGTPEPAGEPAEQGTSGGAGRNEFSDFIADIVHNHLGDTGLSGHLRDLGQALEGLAEESTRSPAEEPEGSEEGSTPLDPSRSGNRLVALRVSEAFTETARQILANPELAALRREIEAVVRENPAVALALALSAGAIAALADVDVEGSESWDLGAGFNLGITFDMGPIQSLQFNNLAASVRYSYQNFSTSLGGGVTVDRPEEAGEEEQVVGYGTGEVRFGDRTNYFSATVRIDSEGQFLVRGRLSAGLELWGSDELLFTADLSHSTATEETLASAGARYRIPLGPDQALSLGTMLNYSSESGLGATGFVDYTNEFLFFRADVNTSGLPVAGSVTGEPDLMGQLTFGLHWHNP